MLSFVYRLLCSCLLSYLSQHEWVATRPFQAKAMFIRKVTHCVRKVSEGVGKVSDGVGKVSDDVWNVSDGVGKVSDGVGKV